MAPSHDSKSPMEYASQGLDRAPFKVYEQAEHHIVAQLQADGFDEQARSGDAQETRSLDNPTRRERLANFSNKMRANVKTHTKEIFHPNTEGHSPSKSPAAPLLAPPPSNSTDDDRLYNPLPEYKGMQAKDLLHHPIDTVQSALHGASGAKFAQVMDNQVIAHGANVGLVRAWDKLGSARGEEERNDLIDQVDILKKERQDAYVRWTMDRHVLKVRQDPPRTMERPRREDYRKPDTRGRMELNWAEYGQQLVRFYAEQYCDQHISKSPELPPASQEAIITSIERLLMTSMAYQTALMKVRHIYRWDDPHETAMYCSAYFLLLMVGHLGGGIILYMLWLVMKRWYYPPTPESLREDIKRSEDTTQTALNFTQLIEQHGSRGWLDAVVEKMGPKSMIQLEDLADALEIMRNFYEWRDPPRTARTLGVLAICCLLFTISPLWLLILETQLSAGLMFFGVFPITSRYPQYRHLVSPFKWAFWKISTDAEWAIARIQVEACHVVKIIRKHGSDNEDSSNPPKRRETDEEGEEPALHIETSHCTTKDQQGRLHHGHIIVTSRGVKFETAIRSTMLWALRWNDVMAMSKARTDDGLCFEVDDGEKYIVETLKGRNELFTQIIGYSGLNWQVSG